MGKVELVMDEVVGAEEGSSSKTCSLRNAFEVRIRGGTVYSTNSYLHVENCVRDTIPPTQFCRQKMGRLNRMSPTCQPDIVDMSGTDTNVCRLGGVADRHKSRHCKPSFQRATPFSE
jgi:hypothetical protein